MATVASTAKRRSIARGKRHARARRKISGSAERPRLCVFRSHKNIYAQLVDDVAGATLASASSLEKDIAKAAGEAKGKLSLSAAVGKKIAERAKEKGVVKICFDRGGYRFHGRVKALADAAKEGGLDF
jgi:large subunit ribosomal protein L18